MTSDERRARVARRGSSKAQEKYSGLRGATEALALRPDPQWKVGTPLLEPTQGKMREHARRIIERELMRDFDDSPETKLTAALDAHVALRLQAERLIAAYVSPESDRAAIINELITLFDGPAQREAQRLASEALGEASAGDAWPPRRDGGPA
jgi:hypothetical protein